MAPSYTIKAKMLLAKLLGIMSGPVKTKSYSFLVPEILTHCRWRK